MPTLRNETPFPAELVPMIDPSGRNVAVVIVKGTYSISHGELHVSPAQEPIAFVDEPYGAPESKEIYWPSDLVDHKPTTDVLLLRPADALSQSPLRGRHIRVTVGAVTMAGTVSNQWSFGPVRRDQEPRKSFAGTYDQLWVEQRMPLLPLDFDARYNQAAPLAQTTSYLSGDEPLSLSNVYQAGTSIRSTLPKAAIIVAGSVLSYYFTEVAVLDTVTVWSDKPQLTLVWRHVIRPRQKIEELGRTHIYFVRLRTARELYGAA